MQQSQTAAAVEAAQRLEGARRARRGVVASYIHALSARHAQARPVPPPSGRPPGR